MIFKSRKEVILQQIGSDLYKYFKGIIGFKTNITQHLGQNNDLRHKNDVLSVLDLPGLKNLAGLGSAQSKNILPAYLF